MLNFIAKPFHCFIFFTLMSFLCALSKLPLNPGNSNSFLTQDISQKNFLSQVLNADEQIDVKYVAMN